MRALRAIQRPLGGDDLVDVSLGEHKKNQKMSLGEHKNASNLSYTHRIHYFLGDSES